jgi:hypothetical protein
VVLLMLGNVLCATVWSAKHPRFAALMMEHIKRGELFFPPVCMTKCKVALYNA